MVAGYHLIWTNYGCWLPNDPRGSSSRAIRIERIADLGELHYGRRVEQPPTEELRRFYAAARGVLKHPLLAFREDQFPIIAAALAQVIHDQRYTCYACAIMLDHVHMMIRKHRDKSEVMLKHFQEASWAAVIEAGLRSIDHPVWGGPGWKVYLNTRRDMERTVSYIGNNPREARLPDQSWPFVTPYKGWMPFTRET